VKCGCRKEGGISDITWRQNDYGLMFDGGDVEDEAVDWMLDCVQRLLLEDSHKPSGSTKDRIS
jgi:hypothetical protein